MPVSLLYPHRRQITPRVKAIMNWIADVLEPHVTNGAEPDSQNHIASDNISPHKHQDSGRERMSMIQGKFWVVTAALITASLLLVSCGGSGGSSSGTGTSPIGTSPIGSSPIGSSGTSASGTSAATSFMGSSKLLIGGAMPDATAAAAPFDVRYAYVHSKPAASSAYYTDTRCSDAAAASGWWGCWSGNTTAPGYYVTWWDEHVAQATWQGNPRPQIFFATWYSLRDLGDMAGSGDGPGEVVAINRLDLLTLYMNDYRFFLQKIGNSRSMVDLEPDFWGYVKSLGNPHNVPAKVSTANPIDCATEENSAAGLARCLISMARKYAPKLGVGMHASCFDYQTDPQGCVNFLKDITTGADFMVGDVSDRDAAWYDIQKKLGTGAGFGRSGDWWTVQNRGADALAFYKSITEGTGKPLVLWQIPVGNMAQNNTLNHYQDDKVDYLFSHLDAVADAHIVALLFGAGQQEQTGPETDGGNLINKTINYWNTGGAQIR